MEGWSELLPVSFMNEYMRADPDVRLSFDDGKVIPAHAQLLCLYSSVLREAIKACTNCARTCSADAESMQPVIPMPGTASRDWAKVLPFIYPGQHDAKVTWDSLEALFRIGDKYDMPVVTARAIAFLEEHLEQLSNQRYMPTYIWNWVLLLDGAAGADKASLLTRCLEILASKFRYSCTAAQMERLSRKGLECLALQLAQTGTSGNDAAPKAKKARSLGFG